MTGGISSLGMVISEEDEKPNPHRSTVNVLWDSHVVREHKRGQHGQVELKCVVAASDGHYYRLVHRLWLLIVAVVSWVCGVKIVINECGGEVGSAGVLNRTSALDSTRPV